MKTRTKILTTLGLIALIAAGIGYGKYKSNPDHMTDLQRVEYNKKQANKKVTYDLAFGKKIKSLYYIDSKYVEEHNPVESQENGVTKVTFDDVDGKVAGNGQSTNATVYKDENGYSTSSVVVPNAKWAVELTNIPGVTDGKGKVLAFTYFEKGNKNPIQVGFPVSDITRENSDVTVEKSGKNTVTTWVDKDDVRHYKIKLDRIQYENYQDYM